MENKNHKHALEVSDRKSQVGRRKQSRRNVFGEEVTVGHLEVEMSFIDMGLY